MSQVTATETAWSVIESRLEDLRPKLARSSRAWVARPEASPALFRALARAQPAQVEVLHTFKPTVEELEAEGYFPKPELSNGPFDLVLFVPTRQRLESLALMAHGLLNLSPTGVFIFSCANAQGAGGYLSQLREAFPELEADSQKKCRLVVLQASQISRRELLEGWIQAASEVQVPGTEFRSAPGIYGWNKVDEASVLLVSTLPELTGSGADLGSGYGFLSHAVLDRSPQVDHIDLLEADSRALDCARTNLSKWHERTSFHWLDVTSPKVRTQFQGLDWIVMNPPFHEGSDVSAGLGSSFIESAAKMLRKGGTLYMVANTFLAYEKVLAAHFSKVSRIIERDGFKVIHAER